jgi:serine/threonine protein kinase
MFMKRCDHPNIMSLIGTIAEGRTLKASLMPLMWGNLWNLIVHRESLPSDPCHFAHWERSALIQITAGLTHLHSRSIFHLDVKPDNVLVQNQPHSPGYNFRIADLGNAHTLLDLFGKPCSELCEAEGINAAPYRPFYLFQVQGTVTVTSRFDIWALGCLMFDLGQTSPRSRDAAGGLDRLMSGQCRGATDASQASMWRRFDDRLRRHARQDAQNLIRRLCPRSRALAGQMGLHALDTALRALKTSTLPSTGEVQNNQQRAGRGHQAAVAAGSGVH